MNRFCVFIGIIFLFVLEGVSQAIPNQEKLSLWLSADSLKLNNNDKIASWLDLSYLGLNAAQSNATYQPVFIANDSVINDHSCVDFNTSYLSIGNRLSVDSIRTFFIVAQQQSFVNYPWYVSKGFSGDGTFAFSTLGSTKEIRLYVDNFITATGYMADVQWALYTVTVTQDSLFFYSGGVLQKSYKHSKDIAGTTAYDFRIGGCAQYASSYFDGKIAEIIIYSDNIGRDEEKNVEQYLRNKYAPPISFNSDITIGYGFADTTINAYKPWFSSYKWTYLGDSISNDSVIVISQSGTYSVTVTDMFGFESTDSVKVAYPDVKQINDTIICLYDTVSWDPGLIGDYTYQWSNGDNSSSLDIAESGDYWLVIRDNNNNPWYSDTITIVVDSFPIQNSLGSSHNVCKNEAVTLVVQGTDIVVWEWNTGSDKSYVNIDNDGEYWVKVTNGRGCVDSDTNIYTIVGVAPSTSFFIDSTCFNDSSIFTNATTIENGYSIDSVLWEFGDGSTSKEWNPKYLYSSTGNFGVQLKAYSDNCNSSYKDSIVVKELPIANFGMLYGENNCLGNSVQFLDSSMSNMPITKYLWSFDEGNISTQKNPTNIFVAENDFNIKLLITNSGNCSDSIEKVLFIRNSQPIASTPALISPTNESINYDTDSTILFSWAESEKVIYYRFEIARDSLFTQSYFSKDIIGTNVLYDISESGSWYWRVTAFNVCDMGSASNIFSFKKTNISEYGDMVLWLNADKLKLNIGEKVSVWADESPIELDAKQSNTAYQPIFNANNSVINNSDAVSFNTSYLSIGNRLNIDSIRTFFVVAKQNSFTNFPWFVSKGYTVDGSFALSTMNTNSELRLYADGFIKETGYYADTNWSLYLVSLNTDSIRFYSGGKLEAAFVHGKDLTGANAYDFRIGGNAQYGSYFDGKIAEIIIYKDPIGRVKEIEVENYLRNKYAPPINLGADINVNYGFGNSTILAEKPWFVKYLWSVGDTASSLTVTKSGTYSLTVTDIFGFTSSDTIKVTYPEPNMISDTAICRFDTVYWNTNLVGKYNYLWSTTDITPDLKITEPGDYWVKVTDTLGYSWYSDTITVTVDEFPAIVSLGNDTTLCSGNRVYLKEGKDEAVTYSWSNGSTDNFMLLQSAGEYSVTVTNSIGCIGIDTVTFGIGGVAPNVLFGAENFCLGDTVKFIDLSTPQSGYSLISWDWNFGDSFTSVASNPQHKYSLAGYHLVTLEVQSDNNCGNIFTDSIPVYNLPVVKFDPPATCSHSNTQMIDMSTSVDGNVMEWFWLFPNDSNNTEQNPIHSFDLDGDNLVKLQVKTEYGCVGDGEQNVLAKPGPFTDFIYSAPCDSQIVYFTDKSTSFLNLTLYYEWYVNGSLFSYSNNPSVVFSDTGSYEVKLVTTQLYNQCSSEANKTINILRVPVAAFDQQNFCVDNYKKLHENSYSLDAELSKWRWYIDSIGFLLEQNPIVTFASEGSYKTTLLVEDENGCTDTVSGLLYVLPNPSVSFTASPIKGAIPLNVNFDNNTIGADSYYWDFDDESSSVDENPTHIFEEELEYNVKLKATALSGCSDSASVIIRGIDAFIDLAIISITSEVKDGYLSVSALIQNKGTLDMSEIDITYITNETGVFKEIIKDTIKSGYTYLHEFSTMTRLSEYRDLSHLCVRLMSSDWADNNPEDNEKCEVYEEHFSPMAPYPNPVANTLISEYLLPDEALVTIRLVDLSGRISAILYKEISDAGYHRHSFDVRNISPGMYYFSIESNGAMSSYPIVVVRDEK